MAPTDPDEQLTDTPLANEIALLGDLLAAATDAGRTLTEAELDDALGLPPPEPGGRRRSRPARVQPRREKTA